MKKTNSKRNEVLPIPTEILKEVIETKKPVMFSDNNPEIPDLTVEDKKLLQEYFNAKRSKSPVDLEAHLSGSFETDNELVIIVRIPKDLSKKKNKVKPRFRRKN